MSIVALKLSSEMAASYVGKELLINAISDLAACIYHGIGLISETHIKDIFSELDLEAKVRTIEIFLKDANKFKQLQNSKSLESCLHYVKESVHNLHVRIQELHSVISDHYTTKWFAYYRWPSYSYIIEDIRLQTKLLDTRFARMMQICQCMNKFS